ncbi:MAG: hypothetical protein K0S71_2746 [Clostridia bacterium]|jgi:hypothetical protein|nr:hypothetical protein [Clostridia bacterium]
MSCCRKNQGNFYTRPFDGTANPYVAGATSPYGYGPCPSAVSPYGPDQCDNVGDYCVNVCPDNLPHQPIGVGGISSPCYNNTDVPCGCSLRDAACRLINQRTIIHVEGCKMCVIIIAVGKCFIKAVNYANNKVVYFNLNRVDSIEDVLPRC